MNVTGLPVHFDRDGLDCSNESGCEKKVVKGYQAWFYAATVYNAVWGLAVLAFPLQLSSLAGLHVADAQPLAQVIGMIVGVYAYGYYLLARDPKRYCGMIWVGLAGKTFGPIGFLCGAYAGSLPWSFGWVCLFNDVIWWPAFWSFALKHARKPLD